MIEKLLENGFKAVKISDDMVLVVGKDTDVPEELVNLLEEADTAEVLEAVNLANKGIPLAEMLDALEMPAAAAIHNEPVTKIKEYKSKRERRRHVR